jgi:hypothetical protein
MPQLDATYPDDTGLEQPRNAVEVGALGALRELTLLSIDGVDARDSVIKKILKHPELRCWLLSSSACPACRSSPSAAWSYWGPSVNRDLCGPPRQRWLSRGPRRVCDALLWATTLI